MKFAIVSDIHFHNWSAFSTHTGPDGENSRLLNLCNELLRVAKLLHEQGGTHLVIAGDVFHVRGSVAPSVLNRVKSTIQQITNRGISISIIAGNHDLEGRESSDLGSAVTALRSPNVVTIASPDGWGIGSGSDCAYIQFIPWIDDLEELKATIMTHVSREVGEVGEIDALIIHAPVNGVIRGLPPNGLDPEWLAALPVKRVFAGHYHNHKKLADNVWSIGALAHHTWSDVGSKAGFIIVDTAINEVKFYASHCPSFVELTAEMDPSEMQLAADGNYVRMKVSTASAAEVNEMRDLLKSAGALGVQIITEPAKVGASREGGSVIATASSSLSLEGSVMKYIELTESDEEMRKALQVQAQAILKEAEVVMAAASEE